MADSTYHVPMSEERVHQMLAWKQIVVRAWSDSSFKADLLANPNSVLAANGFPVQDGVEYSIAEDGPNQQTLTLPPPPEGVDLNTVKNSDADPGF